MQELSAWSSGGQPSGAPAARLAHLLDVGPDAGARDPLALLIAPLEVGVGGAAAQREPRAGAVVGG